MTINGESLDRTRTSGERTNGVAVQNGSTSDERKLGCLVNGNHDNNIEINGQHTNSEVTDGLFVNGSHSNGLEQNGRHTNNDGSDRRFVNGNHSHGLEHNGQHANHEVTERLVLNGGHTNGVKTNGQRTNGEVTGELFVNGDHSNGVETDGHHANKGPDRLSVDGDHVKNVKNDGQPPIAICGMAVRLPAGLRTPGQLWEFLLAGGDARGRVPESRYNVSAFHDPTNKTGTTASEYGYFLDEDIGLLDPSFFSMSKAEIERADPHQRHMLEVARECLEDAGETEWRGKSVGCFLGSASEDWVEISAQDTQNTGRYRVTGLGDFMLSNRLSYEMDLRGPSMTIRTACSASLVALHEACGSLLRGDCQAAIVGGANLIMFPGMTQSLSEQQVLSEDGSCKTFSADANGYARGEAIDAIYIKRLDTAIKDGNPIRAIIRGTASNHDGRTLGLSVPNVDAQEASIRRAYEVAGIKDHSETGFVECHGTGTPIGDPLEAEAVARVFGDVGVYIGSIKPNLGHTEGASGLLSVIKAALAVEHGIIPPNIKFAKPNPDIPFQSAKLTVPIKPTPWPSNRSKRVSVNSFGIGGSNAHVVIDSSADYTLPTASEQTHFSDEPQLLLFSANSQKALTRMTDSYRQFVERAPECVRNLAYTLANRREHLPYRAFGVIENGSIGQISPVSKPRKPSGVVMVFTGQGAQWPQMGLDLLDSNPTFARSIRALDEHLRALPKDTPEWSIEGELRKPGKRSRVQKAEFSQPLCTAIQIALIDTLSSVGIQPDAVVGHSSGEIAAAYAVGGLTAGEAIMVAMYRGVVTKFSQRSGAMAAIGLSHEDTEKYLVPDVVIACDNSPKSVTISGDSDRVGEVIAVIHKLQPSVLAKKLQVDKAYHSHHMIEVGGDYHSLICTGLREKKLAKPFFSSVTGDLLGESTPLDARYWQRNLESPVLFKSAVSSILHHPVGKNPLFLEIGPHSALAGPLRQISTQESSTTLYTSVMVRNRAGSLSLLSAAGYAYTLQIPLDFNILVPPGSCLPNLPRYPWDHETSYRFESRLSREHRQRKNLHHSLLGSRVVETPDHEPAWRNVFHLENVPWVRDHKIEDMTVFPFAGYTAIAGQALQDITGVTGAFRLRHVVVSMALVLSEEKPVEIVTIFRPQRLTDTLNSRWWDFRISSHNGHAWSEHCSGQVTALDHGPRKSQEPEALSRKISLWKWFDNLKQGGFELGPAFHNLGDVSTSTRMHKAQGKLSNNRHADSNAYHIHPTIIDNALQLMGISSAQGQTRKCRLHVPVGCAELTIFRSSSDLTMGVETHSMSKSFVGEGCGVANGESLLKFREMRFAPMETSKSTELGEWHAAARLAWDTDIDFVDTKDLIESRSDLPLYMPLLDELYRLCILRSHRFLAGITPERPHLRRFRQWIGDQLQSPDLQPLLHLNTPTIDERVNSIASRLGETRAASAAIALQKICENTIEIFRSETLTYKSLLAEETLEVLNQFLNQMDISSLIRTLAHSKPNLRVLEIGSRSTSPSKHILENLTLPDGRALYSMYTFTFKGFNSGQESQTVSKNVNYATLDINEDPLAQGFDFQQYDLVVARNVVHTTKKINESLTNIKKLIHPSGYLLLQELCPTSKWINYIFGSHSRWWSRGEDNRPDEPYIDTARWGNELAAAGLKTSPAIAFDATEPFQMNCVMIAKQAKESTRTKSISLLCHDPSCSAGPIVQELKGQGFQVEKCTLNDRVPQGQDVLCILDRDGPFFENLDAKAFESFKSFARNLVDSGIFWVTFSSQSNVQDPRYAQVIGFARTMRSEMLMDFATCEADDIDASAPHICQIFAKFQMRDANELLNPDFEYAINKGTVTVGRFYPFSLTSELSTADPADNAVLDIEAPGRFDTFRWLWKSRMQTLQPNEVEVEVHSVGLNLRDVLVAADILELPERSLGSEGAGIVRRIGSQVTTLNIGDRVAVLEQHAFSSLLVTQEQFCVNIPDWLSLDEASCMFIPYMTAMHSLMNVGGLQKGQSVLVHSACGGVGLAAVQLALMIEADLYVTVGSEEKVQHLMKNFKIPRDRIFCSRDDTFVEGIMEKTNGEGVDLVLNSLSGELLHLTWKCVAPFGKMVEIGKRDIIGFGKLDMNVFLANRTYTCVDLGPYREKRGFFKKLMHSVIRLMQTGAISPIHPIKTFDAASVGKAFRYMQQGQHIGRIAISLCEHSEGKTLTPEILNRQKHLELDGSASYLLVGGLGGLGQAISTWMVEHGARHLIYLSRSAGHSPEHESFIHEVESMGCQVQLICGSVTNADDVARAVKAATRPLKGVLQMSMALHDMSFPEMTLEQWDAAASPKVQGTWNLHHATISECLDLDFFVLFSSLSGIVGQPGQANYASANTFLDAFVQYRTNRGLPASAIDIGAVGDIGVVSQSTGLLQKMRAGGYKLLREQEVLDALQLAMTARKSQTENARTAFADKNNFVLGLESAIPLDNPACRAIWKRDRRMAIYHNAGSGESADPATAATTIQWYITNARADPSVLKTPEAPAFFATEIGKSLFGLLLKPDDDLNTSLSLIDLGMDSLVAIELRTWWRQVFRFDISVMELRSMGTLDALGQHAAEGLLAAMSDGGV